jgi:uncharacterized protein YqiB (DUF1249 family)
VRLVSVTGSEEALRGLFELQPQQGSTNPTVHVRLKVDRLPLGPHSSTIVVETAHEHFPTIVVPASFVVVQPNFGLVKSLVVSNLPPGESREVSLRQGEYGGPVAGVTSVRYRGSPGLEVALVTRQSARDGPTLRVKCCADAVPVGIVQGTVAVRLQDVREELAIPILVVVGSK